MYRVPDDLPALQRPLCYHSCTESKFVRAVLWYSEQVEPCSAAQLGAPSLAKRELKVSISRQPLENDGEGVTLHDNRI